VTPRHPDTDRPTAEEIMSEHRECGVPKYDGCYAHFPMRHCRADGMAWPCDVEAIRTVGLRLPAEPEAPTSANDCAGYGFGICPCLCHTSQPVPTPEPPAEPHETDASLDRYRGSVFPRDYRAGTWRDATPEEWSEASAKPLASHDPECGWECREVGGHAHRAALDATPPPARNKYLRGMEGDFASVAPPALDAETLLNEWAAMPHRGPFDQFVAARLATSTDTPE
jgi:hypothetical protein